MLAMVCTLEQKALLECSKAQPGNPQFHMALQGVLAGTSALIGNTVFAFANASAKMLASARQSLLVAGLDRPRHPPPPGTPFNYFTATILLSANANASWSLSQLLLFSLAQHPGTRQRGSGG